MKRNHAISQGYTRKWWVGAHVCVLLVAGKKKKKKEIKMANRTRWMSKPKKGGSLTATCNVSSARPLTISNALCVHGAMPFGHKSKWW